jgi:hypothetical protein
MVMAQWLSDGQPPVKALPQLLVELLVELLVA